jgi:tripartite-type tricarboxylate transporter receptor subunit TctC
VKSLAELLTYARAHPGKLSYGSAGSGSSPHIAAEMFKRAAMIDATHVPYKGAAPALQDLIGGHVQMMFATAASVVPQIKDGKLTVEKLPKAFATRQSPPPTAGSCHCSPSCMPAK